MVKSGFNEWKYQKWIKTKTTLLVPAYFPSTGGNIDEYMDTIDQLNKIIIKYQDMHEIVIGGDLNEYLGNEGGQNKRR